MPTNQQRRDAAKRKLERQLVSRQARAKSRRQRNIIAGAIVGIVVIVGAVWLITAPKSTTDTSADGSTSASTTSSAATTPCSYPSSTITAAKPVSAPTNLNPAATGTVQADIVVGQGTITATLDRSLAKCAVNAFVSLAAQKFYDGTSCHRLTVDTGFKILQCGDPSGTGRGGPGYDYANEYADPAQEVASTDAAPTDGSTTASSSDAASTANHYPVGTIAMASTAPGATNGSQFFIVYDDTTIDSPQYTKIGTVSAASLDVIKQIAAKGTKADSAGVLDAPAEPVTISTVTVPESAVSEEAPPSTSASSTDGLGTDGVPTDAVPTGAGTETVTPGTAGTADTGATDQVPADTAATDTAPADSGAQSSGAVQ